MAKSNEEQSEQRPPKVTQVPSEKEERGPDGGVGPTYTSKVAESVLPEPKPDLTE
jgi:hypothetical protein